MQNLRTAWVLLVLAAALRRGGLFGAPAFTLGHPVAYTNDVYSSRLAELFYGNTLVDSIELDFGLNYVGRDSVVYIRVETLHEPELTGTYFTTLVLFHEGRTEALSATLPFYNEHFSSPAVLDSNLYYWGFKDDRVLAAAVDPSTGKFDTITVPVEESVITDSPFHFRRPRQYPRGVLFALQDGQSFLLGRDMRSVRKLVAEQTKAPTSAEE